MGAMWIIHTALLTATGYSLTLLMASLFRRLIAMKPIWTLVLSLAVVVLSSVIFSIIETWSVATFLKPDLELSPRTYLSAILLDFTLLAAWASLYYGINYFLLLEDQIRLRERLEGQASSAQLAMLRYQLNPHFLFNTLNSIAALIRIRANDQALKMLLGLGELMRATIDRTPSQVTPWPIELAFTKGYIELQQVRFGDRLDVAYVVDPAAEACLVPAFLLQPIVENAFRHGIGAKAGRCRLELGAAVVGDRLRVTVRDDGAGIRPGFDLGRDAGTGLSNIRTRLQNLYGGPASVAVTAAPGGGTIVTLDLPPEPPADLARASA
jgi:two-component system, LytTR family, sensor kinase